MKVCKSKTKVLIIVAVMFAISILAMITTSNASSSDLSLRNLDFQAQINTDGSMDVIETWDISIDDTNTLFKTFKTDNSKYSGITNVNVTDITNGQIKEFSQVNELTYHVTKNCYYGLKNNDGNFEIAWGVGLENSRANRVYEISYTVKDAIAKYDDYAELYWQFVGSDFEVSAKSVTGAILLPNNAKSKDEIKVWGHTEDLNGTIYATDTNKVEFDLTGFNGGKYIEVRTLFPTSLISYSGRTYNKEALNDVINEETQWANDANARRERSKFIQGLMLAGAIIIVIILTIYFAIKIKKYLGVLKGLDKKYQPTTQLKYYRDLPDENATPGEATFLLKDLFITVSDDFGKIFSATLLNLSLKKYIEIKVEKNEKGKEQIIIENLNKDNKDLKEDEKLILTFLNQAIKDKNQITMKELEKYIKDNSTKIPKLIENTQKNIENQLAQLGDFDKKVKETYDNYSGKFIAYLVFAILILIFTMLTALPLVIVLAINAIICYKIKNKLNVYTQKGIDEKEEWKGLKKYMEDFSLLKEREVPEIVIWEKYLVFATSFGIADKVLKQLKIVYPNIDEINGVNTSAYMYFMYHSNFNTSFASAINTSMSSAYSSATGGGGGFSGGGGGRTEEVEAEVVDNLPSPNHHKIYYK